MATPLYRDPTAALDERLLAIEGRVTDLERQLMRRVMASLSAAERTSLGEARDALARARPAPGPFDLEAKAERARRVEVYARVLEALVGDARTMAARLDAMPGEAPVPELPAHLARRAEANLRASAMAPVWGALALRARHLVATFDPDAVLRREGPFDLAVAFVFRSCPLVLAGWPRAREPWERPGELEAEWTLTTSVPGGAPELHLAEEGLVDRVARMFDRTYDVEVGDPSFDGLFRIRASPAASAAHLLPEPVRYRILELARFSVPEIAIDPGARTAWVRFAYEPEHAPLQAAVRVLAALREGAREGAPDGG